jgi:hypothetical protein
VKSHLFSAPIITILTTHPILKPILVFGDGAYGGANQISSSKLSAKFEV